MSRLHSWMKISGVICAFALSFCSSGTRARAQVVTGQVTAVVKDQSGAVLPGAALQLVNTNTGVTTAGTSGSVGAYTFTGVLSGTYRLEVSKAGFKKAVLSKVLVQAGQDTDVTATLQIGATTETVEVTGTASPILKKTSNAIGTVLTNKQLQDLPLSGRNVTSLSFMTPGFAAVPGKTTGTWNGLPLIAQSNTIDGVVSSTTRMKFAGNAYPGPSARLEDIQEMTVSTGQLGADVGNGIAASSVGFVTKGGTNQYHGELYEQFRNSALNANDWYNNAFNTPKPLFILNDFGGNVGGPIKRDKLFFFASWAQSIQPGGFYATQNYMTPLAQTGMFTFTQGPYAGQELNVLQVAGAGGFPNTVNSCSSASDPRVPTCIAQQLQKINSAVKAGTILGPAVTSDANLNEVRWHVNQTLKNYYPAVRMDYNVNQNLRLDFALEDTITHSPNAEAAPYPGSEFSNIQASDRSNNYTASLGINWMLSPTLVDQFTGGYYYNATWYGNGGTDAYASQLVPQVNWAFGASGQTFNLPLTTYYPVVNWTNQLTWQHTSHRFTFGVTYWREQDHYWNPPDGIITYNLGLAGNDPALSYFDNYLTNNYPNISSQDRGDIESMYATLVSRVSNIRPSGSGFPLNLQTGKYSTTVGEYPLDELMRTWGFSFHDSWHVTPSLTANYGLLWNLVGDNHDLTGAYHSATPDGIYGPSGIGNVFQPGTLTGDMNPALVARVHVYRPWNVTPQPELGLAWAPHSGSGLLGELMGHGDTVIRAGYMLRRFTEPQQYYWNNASNFGFGFYQFFQMNPANPNSSGVQSPGTFAPGSLSFPNVPLKVVCGANGGFVCSPQNYQASVPEADVGWSGSLISGINMNIRQPYTQQWNFEIQRQLGNNNVLAVRYLGEHTVHQWMNQDINEANIFNNGFLTQFKAAQHNMAINGGKSFADNTGAPGLVSTPIFDAAFNGNGVSTSSTDSGGYSNGYFLYLLRTGQAGALAGQLDNPGAGPYYCNMVGNTATFQQCANIYGITGGAGQYPINFWQTNPYAAGNSVGYMSDNGFSNYNALQVDLRQNDWHGMQFDVNYTWGHALGVAADNAWTGTVNGVASGAIYTLRNPRLNYGPLLFDIRQSFHAYGTYDLPVGAGKEFLSSAGPMLNRVVGGWDVGTIFTFETGSPSTILGGYSTYNNHGFPFAGTDGGVNFNGVTLNQLQSSSGLYSLTGRKGTINPKYLSSTGAANSTYLTPSTTPGTIGAMPYIYGPHFWNADFSLSKMTPITERVKLQIQAEFLNAFNHPNWTIYNSSIQSSSFGDAFVNNIANGSYGREIQFRANLRF